MSKIGGKFAIIRDNVGKILDVVKRPEDNPEKRVEGKFVKIDFPIITRGTIPFEEAVTHQSEEE